MKIFFLLILFAWVIQISTHAQIQFETAITSSFPGSRGNSVVQTPDEGYLGLGDFLFRTDKFGDTLWTKKLLDEGNSIAALPNEEYLLSGELGGICAVIKIDKNGNLLWSKKYEWINNFYNENQGTKIISTTDNNSVVISDHYVIKLDGKGDTLWSFMDRFSQFRSIREINGFYYGITWSVSVFKFSPFGQVVWKKPFQEDSLSYTSNGGGEILQLPENYILLLSSKYPDDGNLIFTKINDAGEVIWTKTTKEYRPIMVILCSSQ